MGLIKIDIFCEYTLLRVNPSHSESDGVHTFRQVHVSGTTVEVTVSYSDASVNARLLGAELDAQTIAELSSLDQFEGSALSESARADVRPPLDEIRSTVRNVLALLNYHLRHSDIRESFYSIKSERWKSSNSEWRDIPSTMHVSLENHSTWPLDERAHHAVQEALDTGALPLVGMRHLQRAKYDSQPHYKWIDATIAAELAIKEILCRADPNLRPLLIEMPSPPFSKMYGSLLKHYLGQESPFRKQLIRGQEKRNALVHRHEIVRLDDQEAIDYVTVVERAIFHLLSSILKTSWSEWLTAGLASHLGCCREESEELNGQPVNLAK